ncbi:MAG: bacteriocin-protection protein [candidate division Zixibacteria bacterium]|nr:bacteriocin-protection protein [candidate division Zixibacteria bacterium]
MKPRFFKTAADFNTWLAKNHDNAGELWVGYYKKATGTEGITYPESVEEALCYGWIDGIRKSVDEISYANRFTPRKPSSNWSEINITTVKRLIKEGRMTPAGLKAYEARKSGGSKVYSRADQQPLSPDFEKTLRTNKTAWTFFQSQPRGYRRLAAHWVMDAKREETRVKRLQTLIDDCANGRLIKPLRRGTRRS